MKMSEAVQTSVCEGTIPRRRSGVLAMMLSAYLTVSGCATTLGYVPEHLKPGDTATYVPTYAEVKKWAYDVVDGYDSRATMNRHAIYFGALLGAAAVGALAGLAAFDAGSSAITGIPIGTAFLGGVFTIYSSEQKAQIYGLASKYVKNLIVLSDERLAKATGNIEAKKREEAICLRKDINKVMQKVGDHITSLDPKNVAQQLKRIQAQGATSQPKSKDKDEDKDEVTVTLPPADFRDLKPPVKSECSS